MRTNVVRIFRLSGLSSTIAILVVSTSSVLQLVPLRVLPAIGKAAARSRPTVARKR